MISYLRRALSSWVVLGLFGLILISFVVTGMFTDGMGGLGQLGGSGNIAKISGQTITVNSASQRIQAQLDAQRQQQPGLDMAAFIRSGAVDETIEQIINSKAFEEFGRQNGMAISKRLVDSELASIAAFKGPTGQFDRNVFLGALAQRKLTEELLREDIAREKMVSSIITPAAGASRAPIGLITPYASLLLERRNGQVGFVPTAAMGAGAPPTDAEVNQFYQTSSARYTVPETRIIRYASFDRSRFEGKVVATDAEIAEAYKANAAQYAARESRVFSQAIVSSQAAATKIAAAARAGTPLAAAAKANGGEATTLASQEQGAFAGLTSPAVARAAFAAAQGAVVDPQKSPFGWHVIKVDAVNKIGGKSLADVRATLAAEIGKRKVDGAIADFITKIEDEIADGSTFDDVIKAQALSAERTPAVTGGGIAPEDRAYKPAPELQPVLRDGFLAEPDDDASVVTIAPGQRYALLKVERVIPSAPRPLAAIRQQVVADFLTDRAAKAARKVADAIAAKANQGTAIAAAVSASGVPLPAVRPVSARRIDVTQAQQGGKVPPALALLFSMPTKRAKVLAAPNREGFYIVWLDNIVPGNAMSEPGLIQATQTELGRAMGEEYLQQFAAAIRADLGVKKNDSAIAALKRSLSGTPSQ